MSDDIHATMADSLDQGLLNAIKDGVSVLTKQGDIAQVTAGAAYFNVARQRLKDLGITQVVTPGSTAAQMALELYPDGKIPEMPDVSEEPDAAAG